MHKMGLVIMTLVLILALATAVFADVPQPPRMVDLRYGDVTTVSCEGGFVPITVIDGVNDSIILRCLKASK